MSVIGEAVLSVFLEQLFGKLVSSALNFIADHKQVRKQLKEWQSKLPSIQAVLNDAEEKQIKNEGVKKWLADLQELAYDVDDILDEFDYEALRLKLKKAQAQTRTSKKITASLNNLASQKSVLELREIVSEGASSKGKKQPTSLMDEAVEYVGRENEKREILELLKSYNAGGEAGVSVISIVGMGGMVQELTECCSKFLHPFWKGLAVSLLQLYIRGFHP